MQWMLWGFVFMGLIFGWLCQNPFLLLLDTILRSSARNLLDAADAQHHLCSQREE